MVNEIRLLVLIRFARLDRPCCEFMKLKHSLGLAIIALSALPAMSASAANVELKIAKLVDPGAQTSRCPDKVIVTETPKPYREGSYAIDGSANLTSIAESFTIASSDDFSTTWVAKLKPAYSKCRGTARMVKVDRESYAGHSYLRLRLAGGKAYLILDMTGMSDANNLTPAILKKSVQSGNPVWSWGGTD